MKTTGDVQHRSRKQALWAGFGLVGLIGAVSLWTPLLQPVYFTRWFAWPALLYSAYVPLLVVGCIWLLYKGLQNGKDVQPFLASLGLFIFSFIGLGVSFYPYIVPPSLTIHDTAAPEISLWFMMPGVLVLVPIILAYTSYSYWVFRGKVSSDSGYH